MLKPLAKRFLLGSAGLVVGCASLASVTSEREDAIWGIMLPRLQRHPALTDHPHEALRFNERIKTGSVLPGVSFYWGVFRSPYASHLSVTVLAASHRDKTSFIEAPADWEQLYLSTGWQPEGPGRAVSACAEFVRTTRRRRSPYGTIRVVSPRSKLGSNVIWKDSIRGFAEAPSAVRTGSSWRANLTAIEPGKTVKYECTLGARRAMYVAVDSLVGPGFAP